MVKTKNIYEIPIMKKDRKIAISDSVAHSGFLQHAIDFLLPDETEIIASQRGNVIEVKVDSNEGGLDEKYKDHKYLNFITIEHDNNEYSQYAHLKFDGACVKKGQNVEAGDVIGYSGNTGFTSAPHLHFHVYHDVDSRIGWETMEIQFDEQFKIIRKESDLTEGDRKLLQKMSN